MVGRHSGGAGKTATERGRDSPAEAEQGQVEAQQSRHHVSDERAGLTGVEVDPKPHGHEQGEQLAGHKVNLQRGKQKDQTGLENVIGATVDHNPQEAKPLTVRRVEVKASPAFISKKQSAWANVGGHFPF